MPVRRSAENAEFKYLVPLVKYLGKYAALILTAIILAILGTICTIIGPRYISRITDLLTEGLTGAVDLAAVAKIGITLVIIYACAWLFVLIQGFIMNTATQRTTYALRRGISRKINVLPLRYFDNSLIGDLLSRVTNDVDTIGMTLVQSVSTLVQAGTQFVGVLIIMFITNWQMTLVAIAASVIGFILLGVIMKNSQKYFIAQQVYIGAINGHVEEIYSGHNIVCAYNAEAKEQKKFDEINGNLFSNSWKAAFFGSLMPPIMAFVGNLGYVAVCVTGALMAVNGTITFGTVVAFMIYVRFFTQPLQQLGQVFTQLQSTAAASKRVFEFLDEPEMPDDSNIPTVLDRNNIKGEIEFKHVNFGYYEGQTIINDFSAALHAGQKVAIVGPTGAGKTTLVNLLMRFYEVNSGEITVDGYPISKMSRHEVHDLFGMVLQDTWLFEGTVKDNIKYGKDVSDEVVVNAAKTTGVHHFIKTLSKGYDTVLDEHTSISQGQKQLITIARAMVENAPFLILDEATSSVDTRTEVLIQEAMDRLMKGRTSFIIAHRLSTIKNADLILVMQHGDIVEQGTHEELIAQGGFYADLYNSQFDDVD